MERKSLLGVGRRFLLTLLGILADGLIVWVGAKYPQYADIVVPLLVATSAKVGITVLGMSSTDNAAVRSASNASIAKTYAVAHPPVGGVQ